MNLSNKVAIVTGGRRGIGRGIVIALKEAGATIINIGIVKPEEQIADKFICRDLSVRESRLNLIDNIVNGFGRLDILINNAGRQACHEAIDYPIEQWDYSLELLLTAPFDLSQQAASIMAVMGGGKIVNIGSIASFQGARKICAYIAAKHALIGLTRALAVEWAKYNILVNAVVPGFIDTDMLRSLADDPVRGEQAKKRIPLNRWGTPADVANACMYLISPGADYITGTCLMVDGGWLAR